MPIRAFLKGEKFDPETTRVLGVAFALTCVALRVGDCADDVKQAIADKIIALAKERGERNPDILCEQVVKDIRPTPPLVDSSRLTEFEFEGERPVGDIGEAARN